jgi:hypothetical protein
MIHDRFCVIIGVACEHFDCPRNQITGVPCDGVGICSSTTDIFKSYGLEYGSDADTYEYPGTWDRDGWHTCICAGEYGYGLSVSGLRGSGLSTYLSGYGLSESFASGLVGPR